MPLEIKELYIKVTVNEPDSTGGAPAAASGKAPGKDDKDSLIAQCIEETLEILNNRKER